MILIDSTSRNGLVRVTFKAPPTLSELSQKMDEFARSLTSGTKPLPMVLIDCTGWPNPDAQSGSYLMQWMKKNSAQMSAGSRGLALVIPGFLPRVGAETALKTAGLRIGYKITGDLQAALQWVEPYLPKK